MGIVRFFEGLNFTNDQAPFSCNPILVSYCHLSHSPSHVLAAIKSSLLLLLSTSAKFAEFTYLKKNQLYGNVSGFVQGRKPFKITIAVRMRLA